MAAPWPELAKRDLQALHDLLAENHPGAVDEENARFRDWLAKGLDVGLREAEAVGSLSDYRAVLLRYGNGFRDNHIVVIPRADTLRRRWPGFTVTREADGAFVATLSEVADVPDGAMVTGCDGMALSSRLDHELAPLYWNPELAHQKDRLAPRLFFFEVDAEVPSSCEVIVAGVVQQVELAWRTLSRHEAIARVDQALGAHTPPFGVRSVSGVWFVSMPSMVDVPEDFFAELEAAVDTLHEARHVVLDLRGNGGGNSQSAARALSLLYGEDAVVAIARGFDWTVDWRASPGNLAYLSPYFPESDPFPGRMAASIQAGQALVRVAHPPTSTTAPSSNSPFAGRVHVLTDGACASACLDYMDVALRLPGVTHIGLPTDADAVYIDNRSEALPSGLSALSFGLKVYRNRVRANNEYYTPQTPWPGGLMTDEAVAEWVKGLH